MKAPLHILHLEDNTDDAVLLERLLKVEKLDCTITLAVKRLDYEKALDKGPYDLILSDYSLPTFDGLTALRLARKKFPDVPFIFISGTIGEERAIDSLKEGATDYIIKDRLNRLVPAIKRATSDTEATRKRKHTEEHIREQAALLDEAQDAICVIDMNQTLIYWNKGAERLYGWNAREVMGRNAAKLLFPADAESSLPAYKHLIKDGEWHGELHHVTKLGEKIIVESRWTMMHGEDNKPKSILMINTDVTQKKHVEAQLLRTQRMESIGALAGGIAHDLNNALTPILMALHFVRNEPAGNEVRRMLDVAQSSAQRSVDMVKQILSFARGRESDNTPFQVNRVIDEIVNLAQETFPRSIKIQTSISRDLGQVVGNPTQLHQVLLNLCINARDAMPVGGRITIKATNFILDESHPLSRQHPVGSYVLITVSDTGLGMSKDTLSNLFKPFFTTKDIGKGTGLGLSTAMGIVKTHGGFMDVTSELKMGSAFQVYLPMNNVVEAPLVEQNPSRLPSGHGLEILLVDDEVAILEMTKMLLESFDYKVFTAKDGLEAVAIYQDHHHEIKVVVTDLMMPRMNGPETIKALRKINPTVKIIGVSGLGPESRLTQEGMPGLQIFLKKPFATEELILALHRLTDTPATTAVSAKQSRKVIPQ